MSDVRISLHSTMFSINPGTLLDYETAQRALHSTMFSINLSTPTLQNGRNGLYIPLCFLLIRSGQNREQHSTVFTFHYVFY